MGSGTGGRESCGLLAGEAAEDGGGVVVAGDGLVHGHEVAAVGPVGRRHRLGGVVADPGELGLELGDAGLELEHPLHPGQVEPLLGELLDAAEVLDVVLAVATAAARVRAGSSRPLRS